MRLSRALNAGLAGALALATFTTPIAAELIVPDQRRHVTFDAFFADRGAFARDANGQYRVYMPKLRKAVDELSATLLKLQGDGDYAGVQKLIGELGVIRPQLAEDLARLKRSNIPVDVTFTQGKSVLGLN